MTEAKTYVCHSCGAAVAVNDAKCDYCQNPVSITTFQSIAGLSNQLISKYVGSYQKDLTAGGDGSQAALAIAFCYLKLKLYDKAHAAFERAMEANVDNSEMYFYAAACCLKGKKAFLAPRADIDKALKYIEAATMIEPRAVYDYLSAYIKYDFFHRKGYNISPTFEQDLQSAKAKGLAHGDVDHLYSVLSVDRPTGL